MTHSPDIAKADPVSTPGQMGWAAHLRATLSLGVPLVGSQLGLMLMNTTDTVMLGWYGVEELAASVLATQFFFVVMIFGAGFSQAVIPMAAQAEGEGDVRGARRAVRMGMWVSILYCILVLPILWNTQSILLLLGQETRISTLAGDYMDYAMWALFPTLLAHTLRAFLSAIERARIIFLSTLAAALLNVLVNWLLIFGNLGFPELGIRGAAVATMLVNIAMFAAMAVYTVRQRDAARFELFVRFWRPDWPAFLDVLRLGIPISITILAEVGMFISSSLFMGWIGVVTLAAHGIVLQLASIAFMVPLGMSQAATVRVGRAYGRRDVRGLNRAAATVMAVCLVFGMFSALLFFAMPETLISLFLDETKAEAADVVRLAIPFLMVAAAFQLLDTAQAVGVGLLRGMKDTRVPMYLAIASYWIVGLPLAYGLGFPAGFGGVGVWSGLAAGLLCATVLLNGRFWMMRPRER